MRPRLAWIGDRESRPRRYAIALVICAAAAGLTVLMMELAHTPHATAAMLAAILLAGWYAGTGPAFLVLGLCMILDRTLPALVEGTPSLAPGLRDVWFVFFAIAAARFGAERRQAVRALHASNERLEQEVAARTRELRRKERHLERARRRARERAMRLRFAAQLAERNRLAREMHDTLLQGFTGVALKLVAAANEIGDGAESSRPLDDVIALAQRTLEDARRAIWDIRAPAGSPDLPETIAAAAAEVAAGTGMRVDVETVGNRRVLTPAIDAVVLRVAREAVSNAVKHSTSPVVRLRLRYRRDYVRLVVSDEGRGFLVAPERRAYGAHWGLVGMRERASEAGGRLTVRSGDGRGTTVTLTVPSPSTRLAPPVHPPRARAAPP